MRKIKYKVDFSNREIIVKSAMQNDNISLEIEVLDNGEQVSLADSNIELLWVKPDNFPKKISENITLQNNKIIVNDVDAECTSVSGICNFELTIKKSDKQISTFPLTLKVIQSVINNPSVENTVMKLLEDLIIASNNGENVLVAMDKWAEEHQDLENIADVLSSVKNSVKELSSQIDEIEKQELRTETLNTAVETYVNTAIDDGKMANLVIGDKSIRANEKIVDKSITEELISDDIYSNTPDYSYNGQINCNGGWAFISLTFDLGEVKDSPSLELVYCFNNILADKEITSIKYIQYKSSIDNKTYSNYNNIPNYNNISISLNAKENIKFDTTESFRYIILTIWLDAYNITSSSSNINMSKLNLLYDDNIALPLYDTSYYNDNKLVTYKLLEKEIEKYSNNKTGRYDFTDDLLSDEIDNSKEFNIGSKSAWSGFLLKFDLGTEIEVLEENEIEIRFIISKLVGDKSPTKLNNVAYGFTDKISSTPSYSYITVGDKSLNLKEEKNIIFTTNEVKRFLTVWITFDSYNDTNAFAKVDKFQIFVNNKIYTKIVSDNLDEYAEEKLINFGVLTNQLNKYKEFEGKILAMEGDSLTAGYNGASNSYVDFVKKFFKYANVYNCGSSGGGTQRLVKSVTNGRIDRGDPTYIKPILEEDFENLIAVVFNIGTNGGVTGDIETSIPQFNETTVESALVEGGFEYEGNIIDTEEKYWSLFANDWYGNMGLCIEYIRFKNPKTQIFLAPPCVSSIADTSKSSAKTIASAMLKLVELYGVNYIDTINGLGISRRNNHLYRVDYVHGTNLRNEMYGNYVSRQVYVKLTETNSEK